ncbi:hypothetical protein HUJ05_004357 [Dendroctonus ponderosae]|nr:hypothetical protein HUJ05_004357 [Dendroctonus ponderosae]
MNGIMWNNCIGHCTDGAQSMAEHKTGLQTLASKVINFVKNCPLNQTYPQNCVKKCELITRHFCTIVKCAGYLVLSKNQK